MVERKTSTISLTMNDAELRHWDRSHYWHAFTQMAEYQPFIIHRAEGVWLFDSQGRAFLDGVSSMWCNVHGHGHPHINQAIADQLNRVAHVTSLGMSNSTTIELVKRLVELTPQGLEHPFFSSDGACAVEVALKMAFQYWRQIPSPQPERNLFLALGDAYHGDTIGSVSVGGVSRFHAMFSPLLFDVMRGPCPDTYRLPPQFAANSPSAKGQVTAPNQDKHLTDFYLAHYARLIDDFADRLVAVVIEPLVQGAAGMVMHPPGFLSGIRELTRKHGILLIADEVATGMGRTGRMWACDWENVQPDFLCLGKGLTGGYLPMAATITTREVWNAFLGTYEESRSFFHGHTYGGNPLAAAAALATLELFETEKTLENVTQQGEYLEACLQPLADHPQIGNIRRRGLMAAVELVSNRESQTPYPWQERRGWRACMAALDRNVWLRPLGNVIVLMPPLCCREQHIEQLVAAVAHGVRAATTD
jgi:adenosylmethionine---8-amino-7-oxononanoate aminotransferase